MSDCRGFPIYVSDPISYDDKRSIMKVLLIGSGGREHALAWKLSQSPELSSLFCTPGNPGIASLAGTPPINSTDFQAVVGFCRSVAVDLVVVGPEVPLVAGMADELRAAGIAVFGPSQAAAKLEASKAFTKTLCTERAIPTAAHAVFSDEERAKAYVQKAGAPLVVKADGLAAGKGVVICETIAEAIDAITECFSGVFGEAGASVVIEEKLEGEELSFFAICDGESALPLASAQDYKRAFDGDRGPNTGGMGAASPAPLMTLALQSRVMDEIVQPTLAGMAVRGTPFQGVLYAGLMITDDGPKLIEYNVRFGDPECQVLMLRLKSDLLPILYAAATSRLNGQTIEWHDDAAIATVMATGGYPGPVEKGSIIRDVEHVASIPGVTVFHAGTALSSNGELIANGGRVLNVCATAPSVASSRSYL